MTLPMRTTDNPGMERWLLVSDVDDTLLGDDETLAHLASALKDIRNHLAIAYNSSRPCVSLRQTLDQNPHLPQPDYLIGALGTEIEDGASGQPVDAFDQALAADWRHGDVATLMSELGFEAHAEEYQTPFKASFHVPGTGSYRRAMAHLKKADLRVKVIYSAEQNFDVIPAGAGKGQAAEFLRRHIGLPADRVVVAGDSANDRDVFFPSFKGIIVANADPVLKALTGPNVFHAASPRAAGVLEGLRHWGVVGSE